jgi:DNA-directed RNA polymerase subunit beta'
MAKEVNIVDPDELSVSGDAIHEMLSSVNVNEQLKRLKKEVLDVKSPSKRDAMVKKIKYLAGLQKLDMKPEHAYVIHSMPVVPPLVRPSIPMGGNRIEYADVNTLYRDHMVVNNSFRDIKDFAPADQLVNERKALYDGAKAIFGLGEAITGSARGKQLKGFIQQIAGDTGPKGGYFHNKLLSKKQDFSGRGTIYAEPNLGFNEAAIPVDMLWTMYQFHIIRDLVRSGYDYVAAKKAVEARNTAATNSFDKLIKQIPVILNRAPTLMRTNITAHYPKPIQGKTIGVHPLHLPLYAGDYDGDALTVHVPMTPEAVAEARDKLLPEAHIYDYRKGNGHEAIVGSTYITEPDMKQEVREFKTEAEVLKALEAGEITENTPIRLIS